MLASVISRLQSVSTNPVVERALKTFVEATAAQAALYTTIVPNSPGVKTAGAVSAGATLLSVVWNMALAYATKAKSAKLDALAAAIDKVVDQRLAEQGVKPDDYVAPRKQA